jgi:hypothetical protein
LLRELANWLPQQSIRTSLPVDYTVTFWHQHFLSTMQTGDLILYSGCSAIDSAVKVRSRINTMPGSIH